MAKKIRRATAEEKVAYRKGNPVYPLWGFAEISGQRCPVEDLAGDPDLRYEIMAPAGFIFDGEEVHSLLCDSMAVLRLYAQHVSLRECLCADCKKNRKLQAAVAAELETRA